MLVLLNKTRFKTKQSTLSAKGPAHITSFNATAQPCRPPDQSESANLSNAQKNHLNIWAKRGGADYSLSFGGWGDPCPWMSAV